MLRLIFIILWILPMNTFAISRDVGRPLKISLSNNGLLPFDINSHGLVQITFYSAVLGKLLSISNSYEIEPELLEAAYFDWDSDRYILRLRKNLRFHNGRMANSDDLEFSLVRFFLTTGRADQLVFLRQIKGITDLKPGVFKPGSVRGITKVDEYTLGISLDELNPSFLYSLSEAWILCCPS